MSSRENFFQKVKQNNDVDDEFKRAFIRDLLEYQTKTQELLEQISSWFDGSPITATMSRKSIEDSIERGRVNTVPALFLKNGEKTLSIDPEGLRINNGITGSLTVKIINMSRADNTEIFNLYMRDDNIKDPSVTGWLIVSGKEPNRIATAFTEENFFRAIDSFA